MKNYQKPKTSFIKKRSWDSLMIVSLISSLLMLFSCTKTNSILSFSVTETAGLPRGLEYIELQIPINRSSDILSGICIKEKNQDRSIRGQVLDSLVQPSGGKTYTCLFPISIGANETKEFEVIPGGGTLHEEQLKTDGIRQNLKIENSYFIADLTDIKATPENGLGSGQLAGLVLKHFKNQLLQRSHINMHWAPNFQKEGFDYKTFGHIIEPDSLVIKKGHYFTSIYKSGFVDGYNEIRVTGEYQFYAGLPYFIFSSEIKMDKDIELMLLRNDEMTMDSLFTHVMYLHPDGEMNTIALYEGNNIEKLAEDPIRDDATWVCFYNEALNYGFGSIRLEYDNTNIQGQASPLYKEHTKISPSANNGRYWNRRLIHDHSTLIPEGSKYYEKNAYLVFNANPEDPSAEINA